MPMQFKIWIDRKRKEGDDEGDKACAERHSIGSRDPEVCSAAARGCYEVASLTSLVVMRMAKAMKWIPLSVVGSRW